MIAARVLHLVGFALVCGLSQVSACADLPTIASDVCGNGFVEPEAGEECDASDTTICHAPGKTNACRWVCAVDADCATRTGDAQTAWVCGGDAVCRVAVGNFAAVPGSVAVDAFEVTLAKFDGRAVAGVMPARPLQAMTNGPAGITVNWLDGAGALETTLSIPANTPHPGVGRLVEDQPASFGFNVGAGLGVMLGQPDRSFKPTSNAAITLNDGTSALRVVAANVIADRPGDEQVAVGEKNGKTAVLVYRSPTDIALMYAFARPISAIAGPILHGHLDAQRPCDALIIPFTGDAKVGVFATCTGPSAADVIVNKTALDATARVALPGASTVLGKSFLLDVDGDADHNLDLLVVASCGTGAATCVEIDVAYGKGDGTFESSQGANKAEPYARISVPAAADALTAYLPQAVADLNGDGVLDFVDATRIVVSKPPPGCTPPASCKAVPPPVAGFILSGAAADDYAAQDVNAGAPWTDVEIADFDANGVLDVIAGSATATGIDFFNGAGGGAFNRTLIPTLGSVASFVDGDFDGDLVRDLAYVEHADDGGDDAFSVAFGRPFAAPAAPVAMGRFAKIEQLVDANFSGLSEDAIRDLVIVSIDPVPDVIAWRVAIVLGDSARQLQAPLVFLNNTDPTGQLVEAPLASAIGRFKANERGIAVISGQPVEAGEHPLAHAWYVAATPLNGNDVQLAQSTFKGIDGLIGYPGTVSLVPVDLDAHADGVEELILAGLFRDASVAQFAAKGGLAVGRLDAMGKFSATLRYSDPKRSLSHLHARDFDGDGFPDVAAVAAALGAGSTSGTLQLVMFWNDGKGGLLDPVTIPLNGDAVALAGLNADADRAIELAVIVRDPSSKSTASYLVDFAGRLGNAAIIEGISGGRALAGGDVTGDGVDDLVVASPGSLTVFQGASRHP